MKRLQVEGATIDYEVYGDGEPVLLIHLSLLPDGLIRPLVAEPDLASRYQLIHYYRRGYLGSTPGAGPLTLACQVSDATALLTHLKVKAAHVAGHSYGAIIALQLALDAPDLVHSLALMEPVLRMVPSGQRSFNEDILPVMEAYRTGDKRKAVHIFSDKIFGPHWESVVQQAIPGGTTQAAEYMDLFMQEQSVIRDWQFGPKQAASIHLPLLSMVGIRSHQMMKEGRDLLHSWFPQTEDCDVNATHLLQMQDPGGVAAGLAAFFGRHPIV